MVKDRGVCVPFRIAIAHANFRAADQCCIAEDDPGFVLAGCETLPENAEGGWHWLRIRHRAGGNGIARGEKPNNHENSRGQKYRKGDHFDTEAPLSAGFGIASNDTI